MKRFVPVALLTIGFLAGRITGSTVVSVKAAQAPLAPTPATPLHWSIDDILKIHPGIMARAAAGASNGGASPGIPLPVTPRYKMYIVNRQFHDAAAPARYSHLMSRWDDGEEHARVTDFYVVIGGSGTIVMGGELENKVNIPDPDGPVADEFRGQPVTGGRRYQVKTGDWLIVPPHTPHWAQPDPGGMTSMILQIRDDDPFAKARSGVQ